MTVLFINEFDAKAPFVKELSENLVRKRIDVCILDIKKHRLIRYSSSNRKGEIEEIVTNGFLGKIIQFRIFNIIFKLIYYNWIYNFPKYDHVSYHYVGSIYLFFHRRLSHKGKIKSSAILWGSDFYRSSTFDDKLKRILYRQVDFIGIGNPVMRKDFLKVYPEFGSKVRRVVFGISKLTNISDIQSGGNSIELRNKWKVDEDKTIITIGYNGRKQQQHLKIIDALSDSFKNKREKIHILIPFGYLGSKEYKTEIISKLKQLGVGYTIIDWYSTDEEVAEYRILTDVAINGQTTDALSASIQEHFFAGSVLLTGQWLPYDYFRELGLEFKSFSWDNLQNEFNSIIEDLSKQKNDAAKNREIIWSHSSWTSAIEGWYMLYSNEDY